MTALVTGGLQSILAAIGPKQTSVFASHMSAFGVKQTCFIAAQMSAFDPKRTLDLISI